MCVKGVFAHIGGGVWGGGTCMHTPMGPSLEVFLETFGLWGLMMARMWVMFRRKR